MIDDRIWTERKLADLIDGAHWQDLGDGKLTAIESTQPTYWEQKQMAYDHGDPEMMLDAIQLDMAIERMTDMPAKAALHLKLAGWDFQNISAVVRDKRRRTGAALVESGIKAVLRHERRRAS